MCLLFALRCFGIRSVQDLGELHEYGYSKMKEPNEYGYCRMEEHHEYDYFKIEKSHGYGYPIVKNYEGDIQSRYSFQILDSCEHSDIKSGRLSTQESSRLKSRVMSQSMNTL